MYEDLKIVLWPDPRLKKASKPIATFDPSLKELTARMFHLMREAKGVGLAAPQVGLNIRMFVINPTGEPQDDRVYVNPLLSDGDGDDEEEEGCLSLPEIRAKVVRFKQIKMAAQDPDGRQIEEAASGFVPRIWQHELDHLNGTLLLDRMGPVARMAARRVLKDLEDRYRDEHGDGGKSPK